MVNDNNILPQILNFYIYYLFRPFRWENDYIIIINLNHVYSRVYVQIFIFPQCNITLVHSLDPQLMWYYNNINVYHRSSIIQNI